MTRIALLAASALVAAMPAMAQPQPQPQPQRSQAIQGQAGAPARPGSRAEVATTPEFIRMVMMDDRFEAASSRLAMERSRTARVKEFAEHMMRDHEKTAQEMQALLASMPGQEGATATPREGGMGIARGEPNPGGLDQPHQARLQQLEAAQGAIFERLYLRQQVMAHLQAVDLFRNYAASGDNAALKQWAAATLPMVQEHLRMAQLLQSGA